jgi:hypothetical protein
MTPQQLEDLYIKSLDQPLSEEESASLKKALESTGVQQSLHHYDEIRASLRRNEEATFGPFFAQKVVNKIMNMRVEIDQQIAFFFKKYQLAVLGVLVALLVVNVVLSDQLNISSILGIEDTTATTDDIVTFNLSDTFK